LNVGELDHPYDNWASRRATLNGQAGFYWTEHWKLEMSAEQSSTQRRWQTVTTRLPDGATAYRGAEHNIQDTRVSIGQFYQFGHNAWVHVLAGAGVAITRRLTESRIEPLARYERTSIVIVEPGYSGRSNDASVNPFGALAVKAYVNPRVFVRSDLQADFKSDLQALVVRIGVGVDF
jgi:hypothetical protein